MFAHTADIYAPDDAGDSDGVVRTTTSIQHLEPGSNVAPMPGPVSPLLGAAVIVAALAAIHYWGRHR